METMDCPVCLVMGRGTVATERWSPCERCQAHYAAMPGAREREREEFSRAVMKEAREQEQRQAVRRERRARIDPAHGPDGDDR